jgi:hypothetical protein
VATSTNPVGRHLFVVDGGVDEDDVQVVVDVLEVGPLPRVGVPSPTEDKTSRRDVNTTRLVLSENV